MTYCDYNADGVCVVCGHTTHIAGLVRECGYTVPPPIPPAAVHPAGGPGTELANILHRLHIAPAPTCQCRAMAAQMDAWGVEECSRPERIEEVVAVMRDEANRRGLPFLEAAGRALVRMAIRNARQDRNS